MILQTEQQYRKVFTERNLKIIRGTAAVLFVVGMFYATRDVMNSLVLILAAGFFWRLAGRNAEYGRKDRQAREQAALLEQSRQYRLKIAARRERNRIENHNAVATTVPVSKTR